MPCHWSQWAFFRIRACSGHPSSCRHFHAHSCWCLRLHYCSSCVASEENDNCLERQETGCAWPASSHTCAHIRWQPESWSSVEKLTEKQPCTASLWPAPGTCHSSSAQGHSVSWWLWVHGTDPSGAAWHVLMANLGWARQWHKPLMNISLIAKPHKSTGKREARGKKISFLLEDIFSLNEALGECLFGHEQKRMLEKKPKQTGDLVLFFCSLPGPKIKRESQKHKSTRGETTC